MRDEALLEGTEPLAYDAPRPDSRARGFCPSCHVSRDADPLRPSALALGVLEANGEPAMDDLRTQPMQPPSPGAAGAVARGHIPAGWVLAPNGKTFPASPMTGPQPILKWLLR